MELILTEPTVMLTPELCVYLFRKIKVFGSLKQDQVLWDPWKPSKPSTPPISIPPPRRKASIKIRWHPFIHLGGDKLSSQISCLWSLHDADTWFEPQRHSHMERAGMLLVSFTDVNYGFWCYVGFPDRKPKFSAFKV